MKCFVEIKFVFVYIFFIETKILIEVHLLDLALYMKYKHSNLDLWEG